MIFRVPTLLMMAMLAAGCDRPTVGDAIHRLRGEAYVKSLETGDHKIEVRFIPESLYFLTYGSLDTNRPFETDLLDSVKTKGYLGYGLMFTLKVAPRVDTLSPLDYRNDVVFGRIAGEESYRSVLDGFMNGLPEKVWLEIDGQHWPLLTHHMTNSWGMEKSRTFTLLFNPLQDLLPAKKGRVTLVMENLVPGQAREKVQWDLPLSRNDFI